MKDIFVESDSHWIVDVTKLRLCGVYVWIRNSAAQYVGASTNLITRLASHNVIDFDPATDALRFFPCPQEWGMGLYWLERQMMLLYQPMLNKRDQQGSYKNSWVYMDKPDDPEIIEQTQRYLEAVMRSGDILPSRSMDEELGLRGVPYFDRRFKILENKS